jgi:hypothetical protein
VAAPHYLGLSWSRNAARRDAAQASGRGRACRDAAVGVFRNEAARVAEGRARARPPRRPAPRPRGRRYIAATAAARRARRSGPPPGRRGNRPPPAGADRTLFDTALAGQSGGTGRAFDWSRLGGRPDLQAGFLAGGLNPANARAAAQVGAYALDVSSGVEMTPGRKDAGKLGAFFQALRPAVRSEILPGPGRGTATRSGVVEGAYRTDCGSPGPLHQPAAGPPPRSGEDLPC